MRGHRREGGGGADVSDFPHWSRLGGTARLVFFDRFSIKGRRCDIARLDGGEE